MRQRDAGCDAEIPCAGTFVTFLLVQPRVTFFGTCDAGCDAKIRCGARDVTDVTLVTFFQNL
jgi:hypothetical protein